MSMSTATTTPTGRDYSTSFTVEQSPEEVYASIVDVTAWWTGQIGGRADEVGAEFSYSHLPQHYSLQQVVELDPSRRVLWQVIDSHLAGFSEPSEWTGSHIAFDIVAAAGGTEVRFTHLGLKPTVECFGACSTAWHHYINGSLHNLITAGAGLPDPW